MSFSFNEVFERAISRWGEAAQTDILIEEMSELTKAIIKYRRNADEKARQDILEEMADVKIMLSQMGLIFGDCSRFMADKMLRLKGRLDELDEREIAMKEAGRE